MEEERHEVYERIPWESLEKKTPDKQWIAYAVAAAVVVGALGFSFMQNRPIQHAAVPVSAVASTTAPAVVEAPPPSTPSPVVVAEADLFAVDPESLQDTAATHAERFAIEYFSFDHTPESASVVASLLPADVPGSSAEEGVQVFVDWVGTIGVVQTGPAAYDVEVLVRSLQSSTDSAFARQPTRVATVPIGFDPQGNPQVVAPPTVTEEPDTQTAPMGLVPLPDEVIATYESETVDVVGGVEHPSGGWLVVAMMLGADGVVRAVSFHHS